METEIQQIDNIDSLVDSDQSSGLLGYIQSQQFEAAPPDLVVSQDGAEVPAEPQDQTVDPNVATIASPVVQPEVVTSPPAVLPDLEKQRYERAIADLQQQQDASRQQLLAVARAARANEDKLFESSLSSMTDEEAAIAKANRRAEQAEAQAKFASDQLNGFQQEQNKSQQETAKGVAAYKLAEKLGLPVSSIDVLKTAETVPGMLMMAKLLGQTIGPQPSAQPQAPASPQQPTAPAVFAAGGEQAPAAPTQKAAQRTGDLIDMFRERPYVAVATQ